MVSVTLPVIEGWPYKEIAASFEMCKTEPSPVLRVGVSLWDLLRATSDADVFYVLEVVPIELDTTGILEPHEFMFTRK